MDKSDIFKLQSIVDGIKIPFVKSLHSFNGVPNDFKPWLSELSPSALYNCSVSCRKSMKLKTPELKWVSIKRWINITPMGITLPSGCYISIKRKEVFVANPTPHLEKKDFLLVMLPYGNVWSQIEPDVPITEDWLWSSYDGKLMFERLVDKDALNPIVNYYKSCFDFMNANPDQIGIHLKRKKKSAEK